MVLGRTFLGKQIPIIKLVETHLILQLKIKDSMCRKLLLMIALLALTNRLIAQDYLEYAFPEKVSDEIVNYINKVTKSEPDAGFYIILNSENEEGAYKIYIGRSEKGNNSKKDFLLANTNRFVIMDSLKVPVILDEDFQFVAHGYGTRGDKIVPIRMNIVGELYFIRFNRYGKVVETGW